MNKLYLILVCMLLSLSPIFANDVIKVKIHLTEEAKWPPFTPDAYGVTQEGLSYILMKEIFSRLNIDVNLELLPQKRMLLNLKAGRKDAVTAISKNEKRAEFLLFSEAIVQKKGYIYYSKKSHPSFHWEKFEDLKGLKIGVVAGHNLGVDFDAAVVKHQLDIKTVSRSKQNFDKLIAQEIDVLLSIEPTANYFLKKKPYKNEIGQASKQYYSKYYYIGFSKKSNAKRLIPQVNKIIQQMKSDGSLKKILSVYSMSF